ncbi:MAG: prephenate dehydratase [Candidatus Gracilibacteria bacterium]|jgi:prephenate dehydratase
MEPIIGIIGGNGRMGKLFTSFFVENGVKVFVSDLKTKLSNKDIVAKCDIIIFSVPIDRTIKTIKEVLPYVKENSAITDFTSVKESPVKEMLKAKKNVEVFGMHPMFGNSNPVPGQTVILCPTERSGKWYKWMNNFLINHGAIVKIMTPNAHDKTMAIAQDLIHFVEITCSDGLRLTSLKIDEILPYISKASELKVMSSARILDQDAGLYGNMQIENPYNLFYLRKYRKTVDDLIKIIEKKDLSAFKRYFETTRRYLGKYTETAYKESSFLIDKLIESRNRKKAKQIVKKELPSKDKIALLGPKNTFSDLASTEYLKTNKLALEKYYCRDIEEVFELVEKDKVAVGIVPVENKLDGSIKETLDQLYLKKVHITESINLPVHHCLAVLPFAKKEDIKTIISHPQALNQCKKYLSAHFKDSQKEPYSSTSASIEKLIFSNNKNIGIIASAEAVKDNNLKIIAENIEDDHSNKTLFVIIKKGDYDKKKSEAASNSNKRVSSIAFNFNKDKPGSLYLVLKDFADAKINLTKIESRPTRKEFGDYIFYIDFQGSFSDKTIKSVLEKISKNTAKLKFLGNF